MLQITIPASESWDESKEEFVITAEEQTLQLEHSLISLSKWESKWHKPFLNNKNNREEKSFEETIDYIKCMTINKNVDPEVYNRLTNSNIVDINNYIDDPMTATTFYEKGQSGPSREIITSELIYYWMISLNIPMECQKWHLNRLLTLIRVCNIKSNPPKKQSKRDIINQYAALNAARRSKFNSKG